MICPACGFTDADGFSRCPQCGNSATLSGQCSNCGENLDTEAFLYCKTCGAINLKRASDEGIVCDTHIDSQALGFCIVCGRAVCKACAASLGRKILCDDPKHREYLDKWRVIRTFNFDYEAAVLYANLEQHGIETQVFAKLNPGTADAHLRPTIVEVLVHYQKYGDAQEILKSLGLDELDEEDEN